MAAAIHRTTLELRRRVDPNTLDPADWIVNPDLSPLVGIVPQAYWKIVGDTVVEMDAAEKVAVDAAVLAAQISTTTATVVGRLFSDPLVDVPTTISVTGLQITTDVPLLDIADVTTVVADSTDTKYVHVSIVYNETTEVFEVAVREKITGAYADYAIDEFLVSEIKEYSVVATGTDLVEV